jgi:hypothetical protein
MEIDSKKHEKEEAKQEEELDLLSKEIQSWDSFKYTLREKMLLYLTKC